MLLTYRFPAYRLPACLPASANGPTFFPAAPIVTPAHIHPIGSPLVAPMHSQTMHSTTKLPLINNKSARLHPQFQTTTGANLNLTSSQLNFLAGNLGNFANLQIDVGGRMEQVGLNTRLTAAEALAVEQVAAGGNQTIDISAFGRATGSSLTLTSGLLNAVSSAFGGSINSLVVGHGLKVTDTVANLDLTGKFANYGTVFTAGSAFGAADSIYASVVINGRGADIDSATTGSVIFSADPNLNASVSLLNQGTIAGSGNVAINTPTFTSSGLIAAGTGNVSLTNTSGSGITINGGGGAVQATTGNINLNSGNGNITLNGGNWFSQNLNLNAGRGNIVGSVGQVTGVVNSIDNSNHFTASTPLLTLGTSANSGDPTYVNALRGISLTAPITAVGDSVEAVAAGDITVANSTSFSITTNGDAGSITLVAGATVTQKKGTPQYPSSISSSDCVKASYSVTAAGGSVDLSTGNTNKGVLLGSSSGTGSYKAGPLATSGRGINVNTFATGGGSFTANTTGTFVMTGTGGIATTSAKGAVPDMAGGNVTVAGASVDIQANGITSECTGTGAGGVGGSGGKGGANGASGLVTISTNNGSILMDTPTANGGTALISSPMNPIGSVGGAGRAGGSNGGSSNAANGNGGNGGASGNGGVFKLTANCGQITTTTTIEASAEQAGNGGAPGGAGSQGGPGGAAGKAGSITPSNLTGAQSNPGKAGTRG